MSNTDLTQAGAFADHLIATEVSVQDKMWGEANDRADAQHNQLTRAATAQLVLVTNKMSGATDEDALGLATPFYPQDWNGFRDYGSNVANLVVVAAFIRSEIKRRILLGEDTTRAKRGEAYKGPDLPAVTSEEALASAPPMHVQV